MRVNNLVRTREISGGKLWGETHTYPFKEERKKKNPT